jgi:hypothetical protein
VMYRNKGAANEKEFYESYVNQVFRNTRPIRYS